MTAYNKILKHLMVVLILGLNTTAVSDSFAYNKIVDFKIENDRILVNHHHNWSKSTHEKRYKMISTHLNPFTDENDYAYIECIDKRTGKRLFKTPTPALTKIFLSKDSNYIIGISEIKLWNPYQLVIFDINGKLIYKKHISASEARLTLQEYQEFEITYPDECNILKSMDRVTVTPEHVYLDFIYTNISDRDVIRYLCEKATDSHISKNFSESVSNWVRWYFKPNPAIEIKIEHQKLVSISLLDPKGERFVIPIKCLGTRPVENKKGDINGISKKI